MMLIRCFTFCFALAICALPSQANQNYHAVIPQPEKNPSQNPSYGSQLPPDTDPSIPDLAVYDEDKVREFFGRYCQYYNNKDLDSLLSLYAEDVVYIKTGKGVLYKQELAQHLSEELETNDQPCDESLDFVSGDYYYPYFVAHYYETDSYGARVAQQVYNDILRWNKNGDYEIVLENVFDLQNEQKAPEKKQSLPNGYQTPLVQAIPKRKQAPLRGYNQNEQSGYAPIQRQPEIKFQYLPSHPIDNPVVISYPSQVQHKSKVSKAYNPPQVNNYN